MYLGEAIKKAEYGDKIARTGWNGKGMYVFDFYCSALKMKETEDFVSEFYDVSELGDIIQVGMDDDHMYPLQDFLVLKTVNDKCVPWIPSQEDQFAEDWIVIE